MSHTSPQFIKVDLVKLHPTQITVGKSEVERKRKEWSKFSKKERKAALKSHWFPGIIGPGNVYYIVDHHHFGLAMMEEGLDKVSFLVLRDLSDMDPKLFWNIMEHNRWVHPYDDKGKRRDFNEVPKKLDKLVDDPYRSLAGDLHKIGGCVKDHTVYSEFLWADFFRDRIPATLIKKDYIKALELAKQIATSQEAHYMPGWIGAKIEERSKKKEGKKKEKVASAKKEKKEGKNKKAEAKKTEKESAEVVSLIKEETTLQPDTNHVKVAVNPHKSEVISTKKMNVPLEIAK